LPFDCSLSQVGMLFTLKSLFTTSMEERERCYSFVLSRTPHETLDIYIFSYLFIHVRSTALHALRLQYDISANAFEIRVVKSPKCKVCVDCIFILLLE
jgi:hypothetical protein